MRELAAGGDTHTKERGLNELGRGWHDDTYKSIEEQIKQDRHDMKWYFVLGDSPHLPHFKRSPNLCDAIHTKCTKVPECLLVSKPCKPSNCLIWHKANHNVDMKRQNNAKPAHDDGVLFIFICVFVTDQSGIGQRIKATLVFLNNLVFCVILVHCYTPSLCW